MVWMLSHAMLLSAVGPVVQFASGATPQGEVLFAIPITLGIWETILLRRHIRRIWLWLPLTLVGLVLAFVLGIGWFFIPALGFGFGLAQLPLVISSGIRACGLWAAAWAGSRAFSPTSGLAARSPALPRVQGSSGRLMLSPASLMASQRACISTCVPPNQLPSHPSPLMYLSPDEPERFKNKRPRSALRRVGGGLAAAQA